MRTRPPNESDWVRKRRIEMVLGVQNEGGVTGVLAGPGPVDGGLEVRKVGKVGKMFEKYIIYLD